MFSRKCLFPNLVLVVGFSILCVGFGEEVPSKERACHLDDGDLEDAALLQVKGGSLGEMRTDDAHMGAQIKQHPNLTFGPLQALIGTWKGKFGINSMSLPEAREDDPSGFLVLVQN